MLNSLGGAKRDKGDLDAAIADFERSLKIGEALDDQRHVAMVLNSLGGALCIKGEIDRVIDAYERLCNLRLADGKLFPEGKVAKERLKKLRKWKDKLDNCRSQAERHPILGQYHLKMGCGRFGGGDNHSARLHFERALALGLESKEQAECWFHLGRTHARLKQHAQAIQTFRASLELAEGTTVLYASLGHSLHETGASFDEIKTTFERAFEKDKDNPWAHSWYALLLKDNDQLEAAERHARKAVGIEPNNSVLLTNLSQVLMAYDDRAKLEEAVTILECAQNLATLGFQWPAIHLAAVRDRLARLNGQPWNEP